MDDLETEALQLFRRRRWFPRTMAMERGHVRFTDQELVLLKGDLIGDRIVGEVIFARAPYRAVRYWQSPRWLSNGVNLRLGDSDETWSLLTAKNGLLAMGHAYGWAHRFTEALKRRGAQHR